MSYRDIFKIGAPGRYSFKDVANVLLELKKEGPRHVDLIVIISVSVSYAVGRGFALWLASTKDQHQNGTNCLTA